MTYKIAKDEDDNEALYMNAVIHNDTVELDWVHEEDNADTYPQRCLARVKTIANAEALSFPPQSAFLMLRLYRRGDVSVSGMACADGYREQAIRLAKQGALEMYDAVYPDVALKAREFVEESIDNLKRLAALDVLPLIEAGAGQQLAADQLLPDLLNRAKDELKKSGEFEQKVGWLVNNGIALFPIGKAPYEKYRFFKAISEVARTVGAKAVVYLLDGYVLTPDGQRTGKELLQVMWVNPDATTVSAFQVYTRKKHPLVPQAIIDFAPAEASSAEPSTSKMEQYLIPAWGLHQPD